jgi:hypothetical protein
VYIDEAFGNVGDKAQFQYGLLDLWELYCELVEIIEETKGVNYPITVYRFGNVPLKAPSKGGGSKKRSAMPLMDDDFSFEDDFGGSTNFEDEDDDSFDDEEEENYDDDVFEEDDDNDDER